MPLQDAHKSRRQGHALPEKDLAPQPDGQVHQIGLLPDGGLVIRPEQKHLPGPPKGVGRQKHGLASGSLGHQRMPEILEQTGFDTLHPGLAPGAPPPDNKGNTLSGSIHPAGHKNGPPGKPGSQTGRKQTEFIQGVLVHGKEIAREPIPQLRAHGNTQCKEPLHRGVRLPVGRMLDSGSEPLQSPDIFVGLGPGVLGPVTQIRIPLKAEAETDSPENPAPDPFGRTKSGHPFRGKNQRLPASPLVLER